MKQVTKIIFADDSGEKFFGEGPYRLLCSVEKNGSLRAAAKEMGMSYSKASKLIKQAEANLGFLLTVRTAGGKEGGGSTLTVEGKLWIANYEAYRNACVKSNQELYRQFFPRTGCVIMASGLGKRFGSNKLMAEFCKAPMIGRALEITEGLFQERVVVTRHESVADFCRDKHVKVVLHDLPFRSDTIRLGLNALGDLDGCMFLPGDQPLLRKETIARLLQRWREDQDKILRPVHEELEGSPVLFPAWAFSELALLSGNSGGGAVIQRYPDKVSRLTIDDARELADVDTPEMLKTLERFCHD